MKIIKASGMEPAHVVYWVRHWGRWYWVLRDGNVYMVDFREIRNVKN